MPELLLEILSEPIPARMQPGARRDLERLVAEGVAGAGLAHGATRSFATPRRIGLAMADIPARQPDRVEERRGPRVGAPERAVRGFLDAMGLEDVGGCEVRGEGGNAYYHAARRVPGRASGEVLGEVVAAAVAALPWPKSMRWADGTLRYVRPIRNLLAVFGGEALPGGIEIGGEAGLMPFTRRTRGHAFMAPDWFEVRDFAEYEAALRRARVLIDPEERARRIRDGAPPGARIGERLLAENAGLVEWPVPGEGRFDESFLDLPDEVLATSMESHQRYFPVEDGSGGLAARFVFVADIEAEDGNRAVREGNERVLRARLADARFFWDQDRARPLAERAPALEGIVFHRRLGSVAARSRRTARLARLVAARVPGADPDLAARAAELAKADLVTGMVGEFPDLQGAMGRRYALADGEDPAVADAIADHYRPRGPDDAAPAAPVSAALALADKIDMLAGFFLVGEEPTGSRDPFALRRAALGVIRIVLENRLRLPLREILAAALEAHGADGHAPEDDGADGHAPEGDGADGRAPEGGGPARGAGERVLAFVEDRLKVHLRGQGRRHDLVAAVFALGEDDLARLVERVDFLERLVDGEAGADLLAAHRRAASILAIEEGRDGVSHDAGADPALFALDEERDLHEALAEARRASERAVAADDFGAAGEALAALRGPLDRFFDRVTVNSGDARERANRLRLLAGVRAATGAVADFSRIEGGGA